MKLHLATAAIVVLIPSLASSQTCSGVSGPFALTDIKGSCTYDKILEEYTNQVYNAAGATSASCAAADSSAKEDLDAKILAAMPKFQSAEEAATQLCRNMYDSAEVT